MKILDVGCGGGEWLDQCDMLGFSKLEGVDPYIDKDLIRRSRVRIRRAHHTHLEGEKYDLVILNHSLEHMPDQVSALRAVSSLLAPGGVARIEVPVADSAARVEYNCDWVELDPPRHLYLHTRRSLRLLAENVGMRVVEQMEAGYAFEFWGSELYRRGLTLADPSSGRLRDPRHVFTENENSAFVAKAHQACEAQQSGRVATYLMNL
jgi:SAM-dependent methyltransferase